MNHYAIPQNSLAACDELRGTAAACRSVEMKETVVCPKPRRLGLIHPTLNDPSSSRPLRWYASHHQEIFDAKAGNELLDMILTKGGCGSTSTDQSLPHFSSSPPFFSGSPPSRVSNPLIQDTRFRDPGVVTPISPRGVARAPSPSSARCVRASFGKTPTVRVEGFDCLDRDSRKISIPALA